jgi:predicted RecB family nuclease
LRTVRHHAEHDIEHREHLIAVVNSLSPAEQKVVEEVGIETATNLAKALQEALQ